MTTPDPTRQMFASASWTAATLFGLGALPAYLLAGDAGTIALAGGVGLGWACTCLPLTLRESLGSWRTANAAPVVRVGFAVLVLFGLSTFGADQATLNSVVLVLGLTYPVFIVRSAMMLADDVIDQALSNPSTNNATADAVGTAGVAA